MVVFMQLFFNPADAERFSRRPIEWEGVELNDYFPGYERVVAADYSPLPDRGRNIFGGKMEHFRVGGDRSRADIVASFLAWDCVACHLLHHSFTEIEIWQPDTGSYVHKCSTHYTEPEGRSSYDPNGASPSIRACLAPVPDGFRYFRSFVRDCRQCRRQQWNLIDEYKLNLRGQIVAGPFCYHDPLNYAAMRYF